MLPCVSISQITRTDSIPARIYKPLPKLKHVTRVLFIEGDISNYEPLTLTPTQVVNIYKGLKEGEIYRMRYEDCMNVASVLNETIQDQDKSLQETMARIKFLNDELSVKYNELTEKSVEIESLKQRKTSWYKSPWLWGGIGLVSGILIAK